MSPDIIEEWYHVKTGTESPISAKGLTPSQYLHKVFGDDKHLEELKRYYEAVKFDPAHWIDIAMGVLQFIPATKWIGVAKNLGVLAWQVLRKLKK